MLLTCHTLPTISWAALSVAVLPGADSEVSVYRVPIVENQAYTSSLSALLTADEQQRAARYHAEADYYRFIVSRAALRLLLGRRIGQPPAELSFVPGTNKKPLLAAAPTLHYNVSHSGNWVLIVIAPVEVGIDVEKINSDFPFQEVLAHSFSPLEQAYIKSQQSSQAAFYQLWTRKEAFVKATAQGIEADFSAVPALDGSHHWLAAHPSPTTEWTVSSFAPATGYAAAVAYPAAVPTSAVRFYDAGDQLLQLLP